MQTLLRSLRSLSTHLHQGCVRQWRRQQIFDAAEQKVAEREARVGQLSASAREALLGKYPSGPGGQCLALATRDRKQFGGEHVWSNEIKARAAEHGYTAELQKAAVKDGRERLAATREPSGENTAQALQELGDRLAGPGGLTENANAFDEREVLQELAAHAAQGETVAEIRAQARRFAEGGDVLRTSTGALTTAELVAVERRLVSAALAVPAATRRSSPPPRSSRPWRPARDH